MAATLKIEQPCCSNNNLKLRVQPALTKAFDRAAAKHFTTPSECVRRRLIDGLLTDGIDPSAITVASPTDV